jgi:hypothetical protein
VVFSHFATRVRDSIVYRASLAEQLWRTWRHNNDIVVTIFGSCRQDSLANNFKVTKIRDRLTYPHYSKEVIQAINFCKSGGIVKPSDPRVFRNTLLNLRTLSPSELKIEFESTDIFVVEIASLLEYTQGSNFYHHVALDSVKELKVSRLCD